VRGFWRGLNIWRGSIEGCACRKPGQWPEQAGLVKLLYISSKNSLRLGHGQSWLCSYVSWPISLHATLGKILESVVAERISHAVETYGLLPTSHFGARKQRSAEQALVFLQERIYTAWHGRRVLSLVSFDVKGAYNGVCKERLLQRMKARGIPEDLLRWVEAFCSERTATIHSAWLAESNNRLVIPNQHRRFTKLSLPFHVT
jgi:hypothetical protein